MNLVTVIDASPPDAMVRVGGELDIFSAHELSRRLNPSVDDGCRRILLDLAGVRFVDAGALRVLDRFRSQLAALGGTLRIVSSSPQFQQRCRMAGLDASFELADPQPA
jgi:anti-sigma B factor antagonist